VCLRRGERSWPRSPGHYYILKACNPWTYCVAWTCCCWQLWLKHSVCKALPGFFGSVRKLFARCKCHQTVFMGQPNCCNTCLYSESVDVPPRDD
jgi:hypothetical protein